MFSSVLLVVGRPDLSSSVTLSLPSEKRAVHTYMHTYMHTHTHTHTYWYALLSFVS
jgi:hypothetical protein